MVKSTKTAKPVATKPKLESSAGKSKVVKVSAKADKPKVVKAKVVKVSKTKATKATSTPKSTKRKEKSEVVIPVGTEVPLPPKAKLNAYTYFVAERRPKLRVKNPEWEFAVLTRKVAGEWKALGEAKKVKFTEQAAGDAERHVAEVAVWEKACRDMGYESSDVRKHLREMKKRKNLPKGPKKRRTPYAFFMMTQHEKLADADMDFKARTQKMAAEWKKLNDVQKEDYVTQSAADGTRYEEALEIFLEANPEVAKLTKRKRKRKEGEPKRAKTAYIFFTMEERVKVVAENPEMKTTEVMKDLGKRWKKIKTEKKSKFTEMAKNDTERYQTDKAVWDEAHPVEVK